MATQCKQYAGNEWHSVLRTDRTKMDEDDLLMLGLIASRRRRRRMWVREPLLHRARLGEYGALTERERQDPDAFYSAYRMIPERFDELLVALTPRLERQNTNYRLSIPPGQGERLLRGPIRVGGGPCPLAGSRGAQGLQIGWGGGVRHTGTDSRRGIVGLRSPHRRASPSHRRSPRGSRQPALFGCA